MKKNSLAKIAKNAKNAKQSFDFSELGELGVLARVSLALRKQHGNYHRGRRRSIRQAWPGRPCRSVDGEHHAFAHRTLIARLVVASDISGLFVQRAADAMAAKIANDAQAGPACNALDRVSDAIQASAWPNLLNSRIERRTRGRAHASLDRIVRRHDEARAGIGEVLAAVKISSAGSEEAQQ